VQTRWNIKNGYKPTSIRNFRNLTYNNPIMYAAFLENRKSKKFKFQLDEIKIYHNVEVYVINFSTLRDHYNFTGRSFSSNYSGTIYVNKKDYAILKVIENWEVNNYKQDKKNEEFEVYGWSDKYVKKDSTIEIIESDYTKINDLYFLTKSEIDVTGNLFDSQNTISPFRMIINSFWSDFETKKPIEIPFKNEQNSFEKVTYNKPFWDIFVQPK
jgi:hypothetical protein